MLGGFKPLWPGRHGGGRGWVRASGRSVIHCSRPGSPSLSANHPLSSDPGPSDFTLLTGVYTGASEASPTYSLFRATLHGRGSHPPIQRGDWGSERQSAWPGTAGSLVSREQPRAAETGLPQGYPGLEWGRGPPECVPSSGLDREACWGALAGLGRQPPGARPSVDSDRGGPCRRAASSG